MKRLSPFAIPLFKDKRRRKASLLRNRKTRQASLVVAHLGSFYFVYLKLESSPALTGISATVLPLVCAWLTSAALTDEERTY